MIGDPMREIRAHLLPLQDVEQELGELVHGGRLGDPQ